jgi:hypothetical protein
MIIFDPLSVIIKLGILSRKPIGTKISIKNYLLIIQEPTYLQGVFSYINSDTKYDIENIIYPIKIACEIYLKKNINKNPGIKLLFRNAQNGLYLLIKSYQKYPIIIYCLKYANIIIEIYINNLIKEDLLLTYDFNILSMSNKINSLKKSLSNNSLKSLETEINFSKNNSRKNFTKISSNGSISEMNNCFSRSSSRNNLTDTDTNDCKIKDSLLSSPILKYHDINFNEKNKLISSPKDLCSPKKFSRSSSINDLSPPLISRQSSFNDNKDNIKFNNNIKKTVYRFGSTGYFSFEQEENDNEKICNEIIENINKVDNYYYLIIQNNINIYDNMNYNQLLDNYINSDLLIIKNTIEEYMVEIDDFIVNIILNYNYNKNK